MVHVEEICARMAIHVEIPDELSENTKSALEHIGVTRLYSHQAESIQASLREECCCGNNDIQWEISLLQCSSSGSVIPEFVIALAQDQLRALLAMTKGSDVSLKMVYMMVILLRRTGCGYVIMLDWFVVIDEAHAYKGAFGCHTAFILRRLRRLCYHVYGSDPSFIFCTATSANPRDHAMDLVQTSSMGKIKQGKGQSLSLHGKGRKKRAKDLPGFGETIRSNWLGLQNGLKMLPKPERGPVSKRSTSSTNISKSADENVIVKRSSPILEISCLIAEMIQHGLRCIAFCKSRDSAHLVDSICAYRAGYVAQPVAASWEIWEKERPSVAIYVAFEGPLDQYFMKFPQKLFRRPIECCHVDAQNQQVLEQHLVCAALEHPLSLLYDEKYFGSGLNSAITSLTNRGYLSFDPSRGSSSRIWNYIGHAKIPSHAVSIRAIETEKYKVIDKGRDELLEEIEESKAFFQVYDGAVYMHQGKTYLVKELDISRKLALCQQADLKYYTKTRDYTDIHVIGGEIAYQARISRIQFARTSAQVHDCRVTTTWFGFRRIWKGSNKVFDTVELSLPTYSYQSQAVWVRVPQSVKTAVEIHRFSFRAGLHAASHAVLNVVPLYVICNSSDLAPECSNPHDTAIFQKEFYCMIRILEGLVFQHRQVRPHFTELLIAALELLMSCCCTGDTGCPNCIQNLACGEYNELLHKDAAIMIIKGVLEAEESYFGGHTDSSKP
ncbi:hypothetical protein AAG906_001545 [Vitis piasezkii]